MRRNARSAEALSDLGVAQHAAEQYADALASHDDVDAGLAAYNRTRQPIGEHVVRHGRRLGTHLGVNLRNSEDRTMWQQLQGPRALMDWLAIPNFLAEYA